MRKKVVGVLVAMVVLFCVSICSAEMEVYDASGQFIGVTDYWVIGGDGLPVYIPKLGAVALLYDTLDVGEVSFDRHINVDTLGNAFSAEHSHLYNVCGNLYVSVMEWVGEMWIVDQFWYPCENQHFNTPLYASGRYYKVVSIDAATLPFKLPLLGPLSYKYVGTTATKVTGKR